MPEAAERVSGRIKWFNPNKGYGFITDDTYRDLFLHISQWVEETEPQKDQRVSFIVDNDRRGLFARQVVILREEQAA